MYFDVSATLCLLHNSYFGASCTCSLSLILVVLNNSYICPPDPISLFNFCRAVPIIVVIKVEGKFFL